MRPNRHSFFGHNEGEICNYHIDMICYVCCSMDRFEKIPFFSASFYFFLLPSIFFCFLLFFLPLIDAISSLFQLPVDVGNMAVRVSSPLCGGDYLRETLDGEVRGSLSCEQHTKVRTMLYTTSCTSYP